MGYHSLLEAARLSRPVDTSVPYDPFAVAGKTILVTGGALGLGAAMARHWASHDANLVIGDINDKAGEELVARMRTEHGSGVHHYVHCDVTSWESQVELFKAAARASPHGGIDVVVANAGINSPAANGQFENPQPSENDPDAPAKPDTRIIDINVTAAMHTTNLAMFWLPRNGPNKLNSARNGREEPLAGANRAGERRDRCIILLGSVAGIMPFAGQSQYTTSKHAMTGLFRALRATAWVHGIRVNLLCPYFVVQSSMFPGVAEAIFLAGGGGGAELPGVVDAATRLVADDSIVGRALCIGPRVTLDGNIYSDVTTASKERTCAVWDCYAQDYTTSETFVWRWVQGLNVIEQTKGWFGFFKDIINISFRRR